MDLAIKTQNLHEFIPKIDINMLLMTIDKIDITTNYSELMKTLGKTTKSSLRIKRNHKEPVKGLAGKLKPKKEKKDKDIVIIIDSSEKHKDKLDEDVESITLKMDGFEKVHLEQYHKQLEEYKRFLAEYLKEANSGLMPGYDHYEEKEDDGKRNFEWGQEVITYVEIKDIARRIHMNALLSGDGVGSLTGHNHVGWQEAEDYKFWRYCS